MFYNINKKNIEEKKTHTPS